MISFETSDSPFYQEHEAYCKAISNQLQSMGATCNGYCNSFGYEIQSSFISGNLTFEISWVKYQTTRSMQIIPLDAGESASATCTVQTLKPLVSVRAGRSSFRRMFTQDAYKKMVPAPLYLNTSGMNDSALKLLIQLLVKYPKTKIRLRDGLLKITVASQIHDSLQFIQEVKGLTELI